MSGLALLAAATTADDIRGVAGLASLTLALIGFFTNLRYKTFRGEEEIGELSPRTLLDALPEIVMLAVATIALIAMAPLLDAFRLGDLGHAAGALPTMFALIWLGFLVIAGMVLWLIVSRFRKALANRHA